MRFDHRIASFEIPLALILSAAAGGTLVQAVQWTPFPAWAAIPFAVAIPVVVIWRLRRETGPGTVRGEPVFAGSSPRDAWLLAAVGVAAALVRLFHLGELPAWDDEMWTLRNTWPGDWWGILRVAFDDFWPPLYYLVLDVVARIGGIGITALRLPSVVFGVATVLLMPTAGRLILGSSRAGLFGAAFLAGLTPHVLYSQEARVYALVVMLATVSAFTFYRAFWEARVSVGFIVATTLLTWAHSFVSWYFVAAQWGYILVVAALGRRTELRPAVVNQLIVGALQIPLAAGFLYARLTGPIEVPLEWATGSEETFAGLFTVVRTYASLSVRSVGAIVFQGSLIAVALWGFLRPAGPAGSGAAEPDGREPAAWLDHGHRRPLVFLLCWITVPLVCSMIVTAATALDTFGSWRYHITMLPGIALLISAGLLELRSRTVVGLVIALLVIIPAYEVPDHFAGFRRAAFDEAAAFVRANRTPDEVVLLGGGIRPFSYYYRGTFPRIGSDEWDTLVAEHADRTDEYIFPDDFKIGNRMSNERIPRFIRFLPDDRPWTDPLGPGAFWLVTYEDDSTRIDWLDERGCAVIELEQFYRVDVRRCVPGRP